jgi:hypothetical protein
VVTISATDPIAAEALNQDGTTNTGAFQLTRTGDPGTNLFVSVTVAGSAIYGVDYWTVPELDQFLGTRTSRLTLPTGSNAVTVLVIPIDDNLAKLDETVVLTIVSNSPSVYDIGDPATATVTILPDNDTNRPPTISLAYPLNGARFASGKNILLGASVADPDANAQTVEFFLDGVSRGVVNLTNSISTVTGPRLLFTQYVAFVMASLPPGNHIASAKATDLFGAQATAAPASFAILVPNGNPPSSPTLATQPHSHSSFVLDANGVLYA